MTSAPAAPGGPRPRFICVGAGKAGTTWLWEMLRQHPDIYLPAEKELDYFNEISYEGDDVVNPNATRPLSWYLRFFQKAGADQICGEVTPSYLWSDEAPRRIHRFDPNMKIIVMLRDPVDRLFSSYLFGQQKGAIGPISFEEAIERHPHMLRRAPSGQYVERYIDTFGRDNVEVLFHHDVAADPGAALLQVERFVGVPEFLPPDVAERRNVTLDSRFPRSTRLLMQGRTELKRRGLENLVDLGKRVRLVWVFRWFQKQAKPYDVKPTVQPATEERLRQYFASDVERIERLLGVDLTSWKPPHGSTVASLEP